MRPIARGIEDKKLPGNPQWNLNTPEHRKNVYYYTLRR